MTEIAVTKIVEVRVRVAHSIADNVPNALMSGARATQRAISEIHQMYSQASEVKLATAEAVPIKKGHDSILDLRFQVVLLPYNADAKTDAGNGG